jgi:hypothetical protein
MDDDTWQDCSFISPTIERVSWKDEDESEDEDEEDEKEQESSDSE